MKRINQFKTIKEAFQNFDYKLPDDPQLKMYDFYFMTVIARNADLSREPEIEWIVQDAVETLVADLYPHLNRAIKWSLSCEIRHIFEGMFKPSSSEAQAAYKKHPKFTMEFYNNLVRLNTKQSLPSFLTSISDIQEFTNELADRFEQDPLVYKGNDREREIANRAIKVTQKTLRISNLELANIYEDFYDSGSWNGGFGGKKWADIARGWAGLIKAGSKNTTHKIAWMDHVYDLQHNTSTVFNKIKNYQKSGGYGWLFTALEFKKWIDDPRQFYDKVSPQLKRLVAYISKAHYGLTISQGYEKDPVPDEKTPIPAGSTSSSDLPTSKTFINAFKPDSNIQGAYYEFNLETMQKINWNTNYKVGFTNFLSNHIKIVDNLYSHPLVNPIIELSKVVDITGDVLFGSNIGEKPSIKQGKFIKRNSATIADVQTVLNSFDVLPWVTVDYGHADTTPPQESDYLPNWVKTAAGNSPAKKIISYSQKHQGDSGYVFSVNKLKKWGIKNQHLYGWANKDVYFSEALIELIETKYTKIKWVLELDLKGVYVHYNRGKDEAEIIGQGMYTSYVKGWWKKGNLFDSSFSGTWVQGRFVHSLFLSGTWKKGSFDVPSGSKWVSINWEKGNYGYVSNQYDQSKLIAPSMAKQESLNNQRTDIYLTENSIDTALRTREGWV